MKKNTNPNKKTQEGMQFLQVVSYALYLALPLEIVFLPLFFLGLLRTSITLFIVVTEAYILIFVTELSQHKSFCHVKTTQC